MASGSVRQLAAAARVLASGRAEDHPHVLEGGRRAAARAPPMARAQSGLRAQGAPARATAATAFPRLLLQIPPTAAHIYIAPPFADLIDRPHIFFTTQSMAALAFSGAPRLPAWQLSAGARVYRLPALPRALLVALVDRRLACPRHGQPVFKVPK